MVDSVEADTTQSASPTLTAGEDPKLDPAMSMVTGPEAEVGEMLEMAGDDASAKL
jgi:hypothetical protein